MGVLFLPVVSLVLSLPAIALSKVCREMPLAVNEQSSLHIQVVVRSKLPTPPWDIAVQVYHTITGSNLLLCSGSAYPTKYCGALHCKVRWVHVYDYLGMFRFSLRRPENFRIFIRPRPLWNLKYGTDEHIYKTETHSQT